MPCGTLWAVGKDRHCWLLALRSLEWPHVFLSHSVDSSFRDATHAEWGSSFTHNAVPRFPDLVAFACRTKDLVCHLDQIPNHFPALGVLSDLSRQIEAIRRKTATEYALKWTFLQHRTVGGVTNHSAWFLGRHPGKLTVQHLPAHSLGAIIDYGVFLSSSAPDADAVDLSHLISVDRKIVHISRICQTTRNNSFLI